MSAAPAESSAVGLDVVFELSGVGCHLGGREVLTGVDLTLRSGRFITVVGPNGAGKSTLLSVLAGDLEPAAGSVVFDGRPLAAWDARQRARRRAVLTQANDVSFGFAVREVVAMGRFPWSSAQALADDERAVHAAMVETDTLHLADRSFRTLSGGEQARVSLARVLAQQTDVVLLDEPTAALDLRHQESVLEVAARRVADGGTVLAVVHDLALASAYADEVVVIAEGSVLAHGPTRSVLTAELIGRAYGIDVEVHPVGDRLAIVPRRETAS